MKITTFTILLSIISVFGISNTISRVRRDTMGLRAGALWVALWVALASFALFPGALDTIMGLAQMGNRMFFVTVTGIVILFAIVYGLTTELGRTRQRVANLIQELALVEFELGKRIDEVSKSDGASPDSKSKDQG